MKRASLKTAKVPITSSGNKDVTDRILKDAEPTLAQGKPTLKKPQPQKAAKPASTVAADPLAFVPYRPVPEPPPAPPPGPRPQAPNIPKLSPTDKALADALQKTKTAVESLQTASRSAPAQYDLAIRYRLDALAHHLKQVAEFLVAHTR
jgi:hypothetical protein